MDMTSVCETDFSQQGVKRKALGVALEEITMARAVTYTLRLLVRLQKD